MKGRSMQKIFLMVLGILPSLCFYGCSTGSDAASASSSGMKYPYYATEQRKATIFAGIKRLVIGMPRAEVVKIMGEPDEITKTYQTLEAMQKGQSSGYSYVYLIQRKQELGSIVERQEKLYKLSFNLNDILMRVESDGMQGR